MLGHMFKLLAQACVQLLRLDITALNVKPVCEQNTLFF